MQRYFKSRHYRYWGVTCVVGTVIFLAVLFSTLFLAASHVRAASIGDTVMAHIGPFALVSIHKAAVSGGQFTLNFVLHRSSFIVLLLCYAAAGTMTAVPQAWRRRRYPPSDVHSP